MAADTQGKIVMLLLPHSPSQHSNLGDGINDHDTKVKYLILRRGVKQLNLNLFLQ